MPRSVDVSMREVMAERVTLNVRLKGESLARLRLQLSLPLIWLAARVAGVGLEVEMDQQ